MQAFDVIGAGGLLQLRGGDTFALLSAGVIARIVDDDTNAVVVRFEQIDHCRLAEVIREHVECHIQLIDVRPEKTEQGIAGFETEPDELTLERLSIPRELGASGAGRRQDVPPAAILELAVISLRRRESARECDIGNQDGPRDGRSPPRRGTVERFAPGHPSWPTLTRYVNWPSPEISVGTCTHRNV